MSIKSILICAAMLCVVGVKAETEVWEDQRKESKGTSEQTAEQTAEPKATAAPDVIPAGFKQVVVKVPIEGAIKGKSREVDFTTAIKTDKTGVMNGVETSLQNSMFPKSRRQAGTTEGTVDVTDVVATGNDGLTYTAEVTLKKLLAEGVDTSDTAALTESLLAELRTAAGNVAGMDLSALEAAVKQITGEDVTLTATAPAIDESKATLSITESQLTAAPATTVTRNKDNYAAIIAPAVIGGVLVIAAIAAAAVLVAKARGSEGTGQRGVHIIPEPSTEPTAVPQPPTSV